MKMNNLTKTEKIPSLLVYIIAIILFSVAFVVVWFDLINDLDSLATWIFAVMISAIFLFLVVIFIYLIFYEVKQNKKNKQNV